MRNRLNLNEFRYRLALQPWGVGAYYTDPYKQ